MGPRRFWSPALALALLAASAPACKGKGSGSSDGGITFERVEESGELRLGDDIIVENGKAMFLPGKVARVEPNTIGYMLGVGTTMLEASRSSVYAIRPGHEAKEQPGDYVICRAAGRFWRACRVKSITGSLFVCEDDDGGTLNLAPDDVILPRAATQTNIKERLEKNAARRDFLKAASEAGKPLRPAGWQPKAGQQVVASFVSSWNGGTVTKVAGGTVTIAWDDKSRASERPVEQVVPKPGGPQAVKPGGFVLVRPPASYSHRWAYGRVQSVAAPAVVVANEDGEQRTVKDTDVIPIGR
jgi:hypothetical protein